MAKKNLKTSKLNSIAQSYQTDLKVFEGKTCFNFQYFNRNQEHAKDFNQITPKQLVQLCEKLVHYSQDSLEHWKMERVGTKTGKLLVVYDEFPNKSEFTRPTQIPNHVRWARFRLEGDFRLIGFILDHHHTEILQFSKDTFYVVFIDPEHRFWPD